STDEGHEIDRATRAHQKVYEMPTRGVILSRIPPLSNFSSMLAFIRRPPTGLSFSPMDPLFKLKELVGLNVTFGNWTPWTRVVNVSPTRRGASITRWPNRSTARLSRLARPTSAPTT